MKNNLISKAKDRYNENKISISTALIINDIFDLADKNYKNTTKINAYMHELRTRGSDAIYEYYDKYIRRVIDEEVGLTRINVHYALNEVIKLNEAEKLWKFVNLLQDLKEETGFKLNLQKCSEAMAKTGSVKYNLYWAEVYPDANKENIKFILSSKDAKAAEALVRLVDNLTKEEKEQAKKIIRNAKAKMQKAKDKKSEGKKDDKKKENKPAKKENKKSSEEIDEEDRLIELETKELISFMEQSKRESRKKAQDDIHQM